MTTQIDRIEARLRAIEDTQAIMELQYAYWRNVDLQRPDELREVFHPGTIRIDFDDMPLWTDREAFVKFYRDLGCNPARCENHFGLAPNVKLTGPNTAEAHWRLQMVAYNFDSRLTIHVTGEYEAEYLREDRRWWIKVLTFRRRSLHSQKIAADGTITAPEFGNAPSSAAMHLFGSAE